MDPDWVEVSQTSTTDEEFEARVLAALESHVGFDVAFFSVKGLEPRPTTRGMERHVIEQAVRGGSIYDRELRPVKAAALAARGVAVDTDVLGEARFRARYFREVAALVGGRHSLLAYVPWRGQPVAAIMLGRTGRRFSAHEVSAMEAALPSVGLGRAVFGLPRPVEQLPLPTAGRAERWGLVRSPERARVSTPRGTLAVRDRAGFREMIAVDGASELVWTRAALDDADRSGWPYVELFHLAAVLARQQSRALFIGCGGGVAVRQFAARYAGIAIDLVEHEPAVVELARAWFGLGSIPGVNVHVADGRRFVLDTAPARYDVAVVDAYDAVSSSAELGDEAFLRALAQALAPGGAAAFNVIGTLVGDGRVRSVVTSARAAFEDVRIVPVVGVDEVYSPRALRNVVVVAARPRRR